MKKHFRISDEHLMLWWEQKLWLLRGPEREPFHWSAFSASGSWWHYQSFCM